MLSYGPKGTVYYYMMSEDLCESRDMLSYGPKGTVYYYMTSEAI